MIAFNPISIQVEKQRKKSPPVQNSFVMGTSGTSFVQSSRKRSKNANHFLSFDASLTTHSPLSRSFRGLKFIHEKSPRLELKIDQPINRVQNRTQTQPNIEQHAKTPSISVVERKAVEHKRTRKSEHGIILLFFVQMKNFFID